MDTTGAGDAYFSGVCIGLTYGKTLQERARLIISVADPSAQEELDRAAFERFGPHHHYVKGYMKK